MSISTTDRIAGPFSSGTVLPFTFKVDAASEVRVIKTEADGDILPDLTLTTDYAVTLNPDQDTSPGGEVTLVSAISGGDNVVVTSKVPNTQPTTITNLGNFLPATINRALDRACIQIQQVDAKVDASLQFPLADGNANTAILPSSITRANKYLAFDANGDVVVNDGPTGGVPPSAYGETLIQATNFTEAQAILNLIPVKHNYTATTAPTTGDDSGDGYSVGSVWINVSTDTYYVCVDATLGAAVWRASDEVRAGGSAGVTIRTSAGISVAIFGSGGTTNVSFLGAVTVGGKLTTATSATGGAGLNLPHGTAPTSPANGDIWTTTSGLNARINGATIAYEANPIKAWVNFNGTGTVATRASFNVSSITDNGTGDYTVNFTNALSDANYAVIGTCGDQASSASPRAVMVSSATAPTTSACRIVTTVSGTGAEDQSRVSVSFLR